MRVTATSDHALRALIEIASQRADSAASAEERSRRQDIPRAFLQSILSDLAVPGSP